MASRLPDDPHCGTVAGDRYQPKQVTSFTATNAALSHISVKQYPEAQALSLHIPPTIAATHSLQVHITSKRLPRG
jgi:hypothetical protein